MLRSTFSQFSFTAIDPDALGLADDAIERFLHDRVEDLATVEDFAGFYHPSGGAESCCPLVLFVMAVLAYRTGVSEREAVRRTRRDLGWRYAMRLGPSGRTPSRASFQRFLKKMRATLGEDFVHVRALRLATAEGLLDDTELQAADSTNTDCRGAIIDTFNLISRGIGNVLRRVSDWTGEPVADLAQRLCATEYLARSIKGTADVDWTNRQERNALLTRLVRDALRLVAVIDSPEVVELRPPSAVRRAVALLDQVALQDVEQLPDGTYKIRQGTARGRVISITDPEARHGRKSGAKKINGHKTHVLATLESQLVTAILITDAGLHDSVPCAELLLQADHLGLKPSRALGDLAYGTGKNRRTCAELGVEILTKVAKSSESYIDKSLFDIDLAALKVTCPAGRTTTTYTRVKAEKGSDEKVPRFRFDKPTCLSCPLAQKCCKATREGTGARTVTLNLFEAELQAAREFNQTAEARPLLRKRCTIERVLSHLMRFGLRAARFFGQKATQFQAFMTAAAYNLQRIATLLARRRRKAPA